MDGYYKWSGMQLFARMLKRGTSLCKQLSLATVVFLEPFIIVPHAVPNVNPNSLNHFLYAIAVRSERRCNSACKSSGNSSGRCDSTIGTSCQVYCFLSKGQMNVTVLHEQKGLAVSSFALLRMTLRNSSNCQGLCFIIEPCFKKSYIRSLNA